MRTIADIAADIAHDDVRGLAADLMRERDSLRTMLKAVISALGISDDVECGRDPVEAAKEIRDQLRDYQDRDGQDFARCWDERDAALQRAESAERLALERYQAIEELHAAMGEASQQIATPIQRLRERAEKAEADRSVLGVQLDGAHQQTKEAVRRWQEAIAIAEDFNHQRVEAARQRDRAAAAERESIASWLEGYYDLYPTQRKTLVLAIRANADKEG